MTDDHQGPETQTKNGSKFPTGARWFRTTESEWLDILASRCSEPWWNRKKANKERAPIFDWEVWELGKVNFLSNDKKIDRFGFISLSFRFRSMTEENKDFFLRMEISFERDKRVALT